MIILGGYQIGEYLYSCGYKKALFVAETERDIDYYRWMGFKQAMEKSGILQPFPIYNYSG